MSEWQHSITTIHASPTIVSHSFPSLILTLIPLKSEVYNENRHVIENVVIASYHKNTVWKYVSCFQSQVHDIIV